MLYGTPKPNTPSNNGRQQHVRRMAGQYEQTARIKSTNAVEAAGFEVVYYSKIDAGVPCSCCNQTITDPLDASGQMNAETMATILEGGDPDFVKLDTNDRRVVLEDYAPKSNFPIAPPSSPSADDELTEDLDFTEDEHGEGFDPSGEDYHVLNGRGIAMPQYNSATSNCGVCNRTGFIGGFTRVGGYRGVWSVPDWTSAKLDNLMWQYESIPNTMEVTGEVGSVTFEAKLPRNPYRVEVIGLLNNHNRFNLGSDWELNVNGVNITNPGMLKSLCTGESVTITVTSKYHFTHFELEMTLQRVPTYIDVTNLNKVASNQSLNDYDALTANLPPRIGFVSRGDILFERTTRLGWVVTSDEDLRSALMSQGHTVTLTRMSERFDPFTIVNPYAALSAETSFDRFNGTLTQPLATVK